MNVVYLSPHFPYHYYRFCAQLKQAGATVLGIGDAAENDLAPEVRQALSEYYECRTCTTTTPWCGPAGISPIVTARSTASSR